MANEIRGPIAPTWPVKQVVPVQRDEERPRRREPTPRRDADRDAPEAEGPEESAGRRRPRIDAYV